MRFVVPLLLSACLVASASAAAAEPRLTFSAAQIYHGEIVHVSGTGFTPRGAVLSHLIRPDGTEYPETPMTADAKGNILHDITIVPNTFGTYELVFEDVATKTSATQRFLMVPLDFDKAVTPTADRLPASLTGVWHGDVAGDRPAITSPALIALTEGRIGAIIGSVAYPSLGCGGELWLISVTGNRAQAGEIIRYGQDRCNARALITVTQERQDTLALEWRDITRAGHASARLKKRSE